MASKNKNKAKPQQAVASNKASPQQASGSNKAKPQQAVSKKTAPQQVATNKAKSQNGAGGNKAKSQQAASKKTAPQQAAGGKKAGPQRGGNGKAQHNAAQQKVKAQYEEAKAKIVQANQGINFFLFKVQNLRAYPPQWHRIVLRADAKLSELSRQIEENFGHAQGKASFYRDSGCVDKVSSRGAHSNKFNPDLTLREVFIKGHCYGYLCGEHSELRHTVMVEHAEAKEKDLPNALQMHEYGYRSRDYYDDFDEDDEEFIFDDDELEDEFEDDYEDDADEYDDDDSEFEDDYEDDADEYDDDDSEDEEAPVGCFSLKVELVGAQPPVRRVIDLNANDQFSDLVEQMLEAFDIEHELLGTFYRDAKCTKQLCSSLNDDDEMHPNPYLGSELKKGQRFYFAFGLMQSKKFALTVEDYALERKDLAPNLWDSEGDLDDINGPECYYLLKVTLKGFNKKIWRRIAISNQAHFSDLQNAVIDRFDWEDAYSYESEFYCDTDCLYTFCQTVEDEWTFDYDPPLFQFLEPGIKFGLTIDLAEHVIEVERVIKGPNDLPQNLVWYQGDFTPRDFFINNFNGLYDDDDDELDAEEDDIKDEDDSPASQSNNDAALAGYFALQFELVGAQPPLRRNIVISADFQFSDLVYEMFEELGYELHLLGTFFSDLKCTKRLCSSLNDDEKILPDPYLGHELKKGQRLCYAYGLRQRQKLAITVVDRALEQQDLKFDHDYNTGSLAELKVPKRTYLLKVTVKDIKKQVWRRIAISNLAHFSDLQVAILSELGWDQIYSFDTAFYCDPECNYIFCQTITDKWTYDVDPPLFQFLQPGIKFGAEIDLNELMIEVEREVKSKSELPANLVWRQGSFVPQALDSSDDELDDDELYYLLDDDELEDEDEFEDEDDDEEVPVGCFAVKFEQVGAQPPLRGTLVVNANQRFSDLGAAMLHVLGFEQDFLCSFYRDAKCKKFICSSLNDDKEMQPDPYLGAELKKGQCLYFTYGLMQRKKLKITVSDYGWLPENLAMDPDYAVGSVDDASGIEECSYLLKITVERSKHQIWRRILIGNKQRFSDLQNALSKSLGWDKHDLIASFYSDPECKFVFCQTDEGRDLDADPQLCYFLEPGIKFGFKLGRKQCVLEVERVLKSKDELPPDLVWSQG